MVNEKAMGQPALDKLMEKMDSRYSLVVVAAKRARIITEEIEGSDSGGEKITAKPVTIALNEIAQNKISFWRTRQGIK